MNPPFTSLMRHLITLTLAVVLTQCENYIPSGERAALAAPAPSSQANRSMALEERPGLGTKLGHEMHQDTTRTHFHRRNSSVPDAMATFHYNDDEGARLMAAVHGRAMKHGGSFDLVPGKLRVAVKGGSSYYSQTLKHYRAGGRHFVIGTPGRSYSLVFENLTRQRMEIVVSVDGLDVLNGSPASVRNHGYVIPARSAITIPGMRVGGVLRAFQFSNVADSRAATAFGEKAARNVGVIGVALYEEDEIARRRARVEENYVRDGARAFGN